MAPCARTLTDKPAKYLTEVGLIGEAAVRCDPHERGIGRQHQSLRSLHSSAHYISVWRFIEAVPEYPAEVAGTQPYERGKVLHPDRGVQIRLDVRHYSPYLPRCQAAPNGLRALIARKIDRVDRIGEQWVNPEDNGCLLHTSLRRFALILNPVAHGPGDFRQSITVAVDLEIRSSACWQVLQPRRCSVCRDVG